MKFSDIKHKYSQLLEQKIFNFRPYLFLNLLIPISGISFNDNCLNIPVVGFVLGKIRVFKQEPFGFLEDL